MGCSVCPGREGLGDEAMWGARTKCGALNASSGSENFPFCRRFLKGLWWGSA